MISKHQVAPRFVAFPEHGLAILYCCKAGTQTFRALEKDVVGAVDRPLPTKSSFLADMRDYPLRVQFVRDPLERIVSCYRYYVEIARKYNQDNVLCPAAPEVWQWLKSRPEHSFEEFVTTAFSEFPTDKHIAPQFWAHYGQANLVWPFEAIQAGWQEVRSRVDKPLPDLPWRNKSVKIEVKVTDAALRAVTDFYAEDYEWYQDVCGKAELRAA